MRLILCRLTNSHTQRNIQRQMHTHTHSKAHSHAHSITGSTTNTHTHTNTQIQYSKAPTHTIPSYLAAFIFSGLTLLLLSCPSDKPRPPNEDDVILSESYIHTLTQVPHLSHHFHSLSLVCQCLYKTLTLCAPHSQKFKG